MQLSWMVLNLNRTLSDSPALSTGARPGTRADLQRFARPHALSSGLWHAR